MGGYSSSNISGEKTENSRGGVDYWVVKLDSKEIFNGIKLLAEIVMMIYSSLQQTNDGGYILGGSSISNISGEKTENSKGGYMITG